MQFFIIIFAMQELQHSTGKLLKENILLFQGI